LQPEEIFRAYGLPDTFTGEGTVTGFISFGGKMSPGFTPWMIDRGIDPATFKIYNLSGEEPTAGPADIEDNIDATAHKAGAKKATTVMIVADNTDVGGADAVDAATFPEQGQLAVPFLSNSWGSWETSWVPEAIESMRDAYKRRLLKGYVTTAAAGDDGAGDGSPEKRQMVDNGAAFPEVAAVGASRLLLNKDGSYNSETPWNTSLGATGGGRSLLTLRPKWMIATPRLQPSLDSLGRRFDGRPVPDFVADGDRDTGMIAPTDEGIRPTGGSSVAAPLAVIMATYIAQERGKPLSWPRDLWRFGRTNPEVYNDITTGNNTSEGVKGYSAGQGYDLVTGWGSIRVQNMVQAYKALDSQGALYNALSEVPSYLTENQGIRGLFMNQETQVPGWIGPSALMTDTQSENYKKAMAASK
jgi:kumamolisin